tara:strand:- start:3845 stop:4639 length:795 start_codon:yes stop_codon:yes gene_type:complete
MYSGIEPLPNNMNEEQRDIVPMAEFVGLIGYFKDKLKLFVAVFIGGMVLGYPFSGEIIDWLMTAQGYLPEGVELIILQPMEIILLRLRIATQIGLIITLGLIILDLSINGAKIFSDAKRKKVEYGGSKLFHLLIVLILSIGLAVTGSIYAHKILIPMLLEFLANDATNVGLINTWQLQSWIGFIVGLFFGSIVSFQTPLVVLILLRTGIISRGSITENRGIIWFVAVLLGAALSPPDPLSMFLVGGPIILLLEIALFCDKIIGK